jgi:hypothetical protein
MRSSVSNEEAQASIVYVPFSGAMNSYHSSYGLPGTALALVVDPWIVPPHGVGCVCWSGGVGADVGIGVGRVADAGVDAWPGVGIDVWAGAATTGRCVKL